MRSEAEGIQEELAEEVMVAVVSRLGRKVDRNRVWWRSSDVGSGAGGATLS